MRDSQHVQQITIYNILAFRHLNLCESDCMFFFLSDFCQSTRPMTGSCLYDNSVRPQLAVQREITANKYVLELCLQKQELKLKPHRKHLKFQLWFSGLHVLVMASNQGYTLRPSNIRCVQLTQLSSCRMNTLQHWVHPGPLSNSVCPSPKSDSSVWSFMHYE